MREKTKMKDKLIIKHFKIKDKKQQILFKIMLEQYIQAVNDISIAQARRAN